MSRPRVLVTAGYFDWFSGYQEVGLVRALRDMADVHVLAGDRVSPIFSDAHLASLGIPRRYTPGVSVEEGVVVKRVRCHEARAMLWSRDARAAVDAGDFDRIIQVMPGQVLPAAASLARTRAHRSVLYGDNSAMYAGLPSRLANLKYGVFSATKGTLYRYVNSRADRIYGYTPQTVSRLRPFSAGRTMELLPLAFDDAKFGFDAELRATTRRELGFSDDDFVLIAPGKVQRQKRLDVLVDTVHSLREEMSSLRLVLAGLDDGEASRELRHRIEALGEGESVVAHGFVDAARLNALFNAADLGVWPVMPAITIQQAMGTGLRVVIPNNDLVGHLVRDARTGTRFEPATDLPAALRATLASEIQTSDRGGSTRMERTQFNSWLSTHGIAAALLSSDDSTGRAR